MKQERSPLGLGKTLFTAWVNGPWISSVRGPVLGQAAVGFIGSFALRKAPTGMIVPRGFPKISLPPNRIERTTLLGMLCREQN